ncbi:Reverse transcriptase (RNA-dependent DNA polymerase) [Planctomycetes bacterium Pan216]|uniref:RNA-directed DNA polymerase n=1 Tax=Kolteria novifilia TaxID=2527975 RepID=A0A518B762_9BACT|nr:Reverse transcriptase (RNA-dependent DNA polymerase) [Planctomycetes bacterium Pan216]
MGFFSWIWRLLGFAPRRNVSRLDTGDEDVVQEVVDLSGDPFKEHHRRRALRDGRLLPKRRQHTFWGSRKRYLSKEEADRLFSDTMRTCDRKIRDLLPDEEQLARYGLPPWRTEEDLARALGLTLKQLTFYALHRERERFCHYVSYARPKRNGGERIIMAPKRRLKELQRKLVDDLVRHLPVSEHAHGFREGRSVKTNAEPHVRKTVVVKFDLKDFFPSVHVGRVRGYLISLGYGYPVATSMAVLMTEAERQPVEIDGERYFVPVTSRYCVQGAPTSPGICNAILLKLDRRLAGLARSLEFAYTRYADDLTFSGNDVGAVERLRKSVQRIVHDEGFRVNSEKTRVMKRGACQRVTGVVVNDGVGLSRKERRRLRAMAHQLRQSANGEESKAARLRGKIAYLRMLNPTQAGAIERHWSNRG